MRTITVIAHTKGGVGKSILAWNLAYAMENQGEAVVLIDLDFQQTLFFASEIRKEHPTTDIAESGITVLQPENTEELMTLFESPMLAGKHIVVDVGGFDNDINRTAISHADHIIVPVSTDTTEVIGLQTFEAILSELDTAPVSLLLNNIHHATTNFTDIEEALSTFKNATLLKTVIRSSKAFDRTISKGMSIADVDIKFLTKPGKQILRLYNELYKA